MIRSGIACLVLTLGIGACGSPEPDEILDGQGGGDGGASTGSGGKPGGGSGGASAGTGGTSAVGGGGGSAGTAGAPSCGTLPTPFDEVVPTQDLHVATNGNDANDGASGSPLRTIPEAVKRAKPGTSILIHSGSYPAVVYANALHGTAAAPIWIGGAPGETLPVLGAGVFLERARYVVLHDFEVHDIASKGIHLTDGGDAADPEASRFILIHNVHIHDLIGQSFECIKLSGVNDFWVLDNQLTECKLIAVNMVGCHRGWIARNHIEKPGSQAVQAKGGSEDITLFANVIFGASDRAINMGGSTGEPFFRPPLSMTQPNFEAKNVRVIANVIAQSSAPVAFVGCVDCLVANNTIVDPDGWVLRILQETVSIGGYGFAPASQGRFSNNLVYFRGSTLYSTANVGPNTDAASFEFDHQLWFSYEDPTKSAPTGLPAADSASVTGQDPKLVAPASGDYHLPTASPAHAAGVSMPEVPSDLDGNCFAAPPSIGALEAK